MKQKLLLHFFICYGMLVSAQDTFEGSLNNWTVGGAALSQISNGTGGGPTGDFLQYQTTGNGGGPGSRIVVYNQSQWTGDLSGLGEISMDVNAQGFSLSMRIAFEGASSTRICTTVPVVVLQAAGWTPVSISIDPGDFTVISGADTPAQVLANVNTMRILSNTMPDWVGENPFPSTAIMQIDNVTGQTLSLESVDQQNDFKILPNPGKNDLNIYLPNGASSSSQLEVFDVLGKRVLSTNLSGSESKFDISAWNNGVYFVKVWNGQSTQTKRFVKL